MNLVKEGSSMAKYDEKLIEELRNIVYGKEKSLEMECINGMDSEDDFSELRRLLEKRVNELFGPVDENEEGGGNTSG